MGERKGIGTSIRQISKENSSNSYAEDDWITTGVNIVMAIT